MHLIDGNPLLIIFNSNYDHNLKHLHLNRNIKNGNLKRQIGYLQKNN